MAHKPTETMWDLDDHTRGKHDMLREYLKAWVPILGKHGGRMVFIDAFAGPGRYSGGEDGSPLIAMKAVIDHPAEIKAEAVFLFIEERKDRAAHLRKEIEALTLPAQPVIKYDVACGTYLDHVGAVLDRLDGAGRRMAPALVMIDPFGVKGVPMSMVKRLFAHPGTEVIVSIMMSHINRFRRDKNWEVHLDELFGCEEWRRVIDEPESADRFQFLLDLYRSQLREAGAKFVLPVHLKKGRALKYTLFFATQHQRGCVKMKEGLWRMFGSPEFEYTGPSSPSDPEETLQLDITESGELAHELRRRFGGRDVTIGTLIDFMSGDETPYHPGHLKRKTLGPMERAKLLDVREATGAKRKAGNYPDPDLVIRIQPL